MNAADQHVIQLKSPPLLSRQLGWTLALTSLGLAASFYSLPAGTPRLPALAALAAVFVLAAIASVVRAALARAGRGVPPIVVTAAGLTLPLSAFSRRTARIHLDQLRSVVPLGRGVTSRVAVDGGWRVFTFPATAFAGPDPVAAIREAVRAVGAARADGEPLWRAMERRHALAAELGGARPKAVWAVVAVLAVAFVLQELARRPGDPLGLLDLGAGAPALVWQGQWFRLVTANLLHATPRHLLGVGLSLLLVGAIVERLAGWRHALILLLAACFAGQFAAALAGALLGGHLLTVGLSGGVFGLLGALAVFTWRFGAELPAGLRLPARSWVVLGLLNGVMLPFAAPLLNVWANAGGALAGVGLGWLLARRLADPRDLRRRRSLTRDALAALLVVAGLGVGADLLHGAGTGARQEDRLLLAEDLRARPAYAPLQRNDVAWSVALDPAAPPALLHIAAGLAAQASRQQRGVVNAAGRGRPHDLAQASLDAITDTWAVLQARLGAPALAAERMEDLPWQTQPYGTHLAAFLDRTLREHGARIIGAAGPDAPRIVLGGGVLRLTQAAPAPKGARVYAVLRRGDALAGVMFFHLPPGFTGTQILPLPTQRRVPGTAPPPPVWLDGASHIEVALFDRRSCFCDWPEMGPTYAAFDPQWAAPP